MNIDEMKGLLERSIPNKRFKHSMRVYETALELAKVHHFDAAYTQKIAVSALLHDCGREYGSKESVAAAAKLGVAVDAVEKAQPILLHAKIGHLLARTKYDVQDKEVLVGILYHTTGAAKLTPLAKVVFLADMLEPARDFPNVNKLRELARENLDKAMLLAYSNTMRYLLENKLLIHPHCIDGYNEEMLLLKEDVD